MLIIVTLNFVVIFFIFKNNDFQGRCKRSPRAPLKKVFCCVQPKKNQRDFVNIMHYLVINRRNKLNINFHKMAASQKN